MITKQIQAIYKIKVHWKYVFFYILKVCFIAKADNSNSCFFGILIPNIYI